MTEVKKPLELQKRGGLWLQVGDRQVNVGVENTTDRKLSRAYVAYEVRDLVALKK